MHFNQLQIFSILFALFTFVFAKPPPDNVPGPNRWRLRATTYKNAQPALSGFLDVRSTGTVGFGYNAAYKGFISYITPTNTATGLLTSSSKGSAYLFPVFSTPGLYELQWGHGVPKVGGVIYDKFTATVGNCGGNCGGYTLGYESTPNGYWVAKKNKDGGKNGYKVYWWRGVALPKKGGPYYQVYLWRDSV